MTEIRLHKHKQSEVEAEEGARRPLLKYLGMVEGFAVDSCSRDTLEAAKISLSMAAIRLDATDIYDVSYKVSPTEVTRGTNGFTVPGAIILATGTAYREEKIEVEAQN